MVQLTLPFPQRRAELLAFVKKHHYTHRCPGVWSVAYAVENSLGKIQAALLYGPPPYPSVARAFCRQPQDAPRMAWQARMVAAGLSSAELDELMAYANRGLTARGFWWVTTLTDGTARLIDGGLRRYICPGYTGQTYHRNGWLYLGLAGKPDREGWLIDGEFRHCRQGSITLSRANVASHYPEASSIREVRGHARSRWAYVLGTPRERAERTLLMRYHVQDWEPITQPRLLVQQMLKGLRGVKGMTWTNTTT